MDTTGTKTITTGDPVTILRPAPKAPADHPVFDFDKAFASNIGWVTEAEQATLRGKRVAIAGLGGAGGSHLLTLARLGITKFTIADLDSFEPHNFNRQVGATMDSLGRSKVEVLTEMVQSINPECELDIYPEGVHADNVERFFRDIDLYVDGLDFFAFEAREAVFAHCARYKIPAITAAPLGMSAALLNFVPGGMSFEDYFQLSGRTEIEKAIRFFVGLAPALMHRHYLVDATRVSFQERRGPSTVMAIQLCAGVAGTEALKILLGRGKVWGAPHAIQFDGYSNRVSHTWRPGGNRNPLNLLAIALAKHKLGI